MATDSEVEDVEDWEDDEGYSRELANWQKQDRERENMGESKTPTALGIAALALAEARQKHITVTEAQKAATAAVTEAANATSVAQRQLASVLKNNQSVQVGDIIYTNLSGAIYTSTLAR